MAKIVLVAVRAKGVEHTGIEALERFEDRNTGSEWSERCATREEEDPRRNDGKKEIAHPRHSKNRGCHFHSQGKCVRVHES